MEKSFVIPHDHPALPGHFPGHPIVPGVVLLDGVAAAVEEMTGRAVIGMPAAKFVSPLLPGEECTVRLTPGNGDVVKFECRVGERLAANGSVELAAKVLV